MKRLLAIALLASSMQAQHHEEITVEVVEVPVYVHNASGPVADLTRDRFELFVNGRRQEIEYFDVVDLGAVEEPEAAEPVVRDARRRRVFLLVFDLVFSRPAALKRARLAAARLVANAPEGDAFAVATHTNTKGLQFLGPFTTNRVAVGHAIAKLRPASADDPIRLRISDSERQAITAFMSGGDDRAGLIEDPFTGGGDAMEDNRKQPLRRMIEHQIADLGALAARLARVPGQKHVVLFSEGFNPYLVHDVQTGRAIPPQANSRLIDDVHEMYARYQSADVFLHAVDIAGLRHTFEPLMNEALSILSRGTDGQFVRNQNDLAVALDKLQGSYRHAYVLGFRPTGKRRAHNKVTVKVKQLPRGVTVSYRRGF